MPADAAPLKNERRLLLPTLSLFFEKEIFLSPMFISLLRFPLLVCLLALLPIQFQFLPRVISELLWRCCSCCFLSCCCCCLSFEVFHIIIVVECVNVGCCISTARHCPLTSFFFYKAQSARA